MQRLLPFLEGTDMGQRASLTARHIAARLYRRTPVRLRPFIKRVYNSTRVRRPDSVIRTEIESPVRTQADEKDVIHPVVTVVIPARNEQIYLAECIDSVLCQDLTAVECIVVDDGSVDFTLDIAAELAASDKRVRVVRHEQSLGLAAARNTGLAMARAPHVTFLDGDDYLFPGSLTSRSSALQNAAEDVIGVYCDWLPVREDNPPRKPDRPPAQKPTVSLSDSDGKPPFVATAPMLRTETVRQLGGFDENFRSAEDFDLWMRALRAGFTFEPVKHVGVAYRQRRSGMVLGDPANHAKHVARVYDRADFARPDMAVDPTVRAESLAGSAVLAAATGDPAQLDSVVALAAGLPVTAFNTESVADAMRRSVARVRKADSTIEVEGQVPEIQRRLLAATKFAPKIEAPSKEPFSPLQPDLATRAHPLNESPILPVHVNRDAFGGVVLCPLARYHVDELVPLATELRGRGHRVSFLLTTREGASVREEMRKYNETLFGWPNSLGELDGYSAVVTLNDWGPVRPLIQRAGDLNIPTFSKVEGVQDFEDVDTGRIRKPYRWTDHVLCQGPNDARSLAGRSTYIVGNSRLERIIRGPERTFLPTSKTVVINSNFTYNVMTQNRMDWLESAVKGVYAAGAQPLISQHHADGNIDGDLPIAQFPLRKLFFEVDVLVSRFSTVPFEAMAHGVPFVYHNPHGELVPTFNQETNAYRVTRTNLELSKAIEEALSWRGEYRRRASEFLAQQIDVNLTESCEARSAEVIDRVLSWRP